MDATPQARSDIDPNFQAQLRALGTAVREDSIALGQGGPTAWDTPLLNGWSGDLDDWAGMARPFDRSVANLMAQQSVASGLSPGTTGDMVVTATQVDYLACMERAFRMRHAMPRNRCLAHAAGRRAGHGGEQGVFEVCGIEYINRTVKRAKGKQP